MRAPDRRGLEDERKGWIMNVKLTDAQLVMLSAAAQRDDRCLTAPDRLTQFAKGSSQRLPEY